MKLRRSWATLQKDAIQALASIGDKVNHAAIDTGNGGYAWGQFLDYPQENRQRGVYGTAAAVMTLALCGEQDMPRSQGGTKWLETQYRDANSRANRQLDFAKIYRLGFAALALQKCSSSTAAELFERLVEWRYPSSGWGEYYHEASVRDNEARLMPTAFAFFVLSVYPPFRGSNDPPEVMGWLLEQLKHARPDSALVERALTVIAVIQCGLKGFDSRASEILLLPLRRRIERRKETGEWYPHHYSVRSRDSEDDIWSNNYIYFPTDAIVAAALIGAGQLDKSYNNLSDVANFYASSTIKDGAFCQREHRRPATLDQYWLARLFTHVCATMPTSSFITRGWTSVASRPWVRIPILLVLAILSGVGWVLLTGLVGDLGQQKSWNLRVLAWVLAGVSALFGLLAGWAITAVFRKQRSEQ